MNKEFRIKDLERILSKIEGTKYENLNEEMPMIEICALDSPQDRTRVFQEFVSAIEKEYELKIYKRNFFKANTVGRHLRFVNKMINANQFIKTGVIDWKYFQDFEIEANMREIDEALLRGSTADLIQYYIDEDVFFEEPSVYDMFRTLIEVQYLTFTEAELESLNQVEQMDEVFKILTSKLRERSPNDCRVYYDANWSLGLRIQTKNILEAYPCYPEGICMKQIGTNYGNISRLEQTLEDGSRPIPPKGHYTVKTKDNKYQNFTSIEQMIACGWAID